MKVEERENKSDHIVPFLTSRTKRQNMVYMHRSGSKIQAAIYDQRPKKVSITTNGQKWLDK
jgi:hypothetical protein